MNANLNLLVEIRNRLLANDETWLHFHLIEWSHKGNHSILNYTQFGPPNEYNSLCRGLVFDKQGNLSSLPFTRFFNLGQSEAATINISNSDVIEKLDGSLVCVFWPKSNSLEDKIYHTRRMLSTYDPDLNMRIKGFGMQQELKFMEEIGKLFNNIRFADWCKEYTFMFEAVTPMTRIVTHYPVERYGLHLIGMRKMTNLQELSEDELDEVAITLRVSRPRRWDVASSEQQIIEMMEEYASDFEGFVLRDRDTGNRVKIKKKSYLERHHLLSGLNYKRLLPLYFKGERGEIEASLPFVKSLFDNIECSYRSFVQNTAKDIRNWQAKKLSRKDLAIAIVGKLPKERCHFIFKMIDAPEDNLENEITTHILESVNQQSIEPIIRWLQLDTEKELAPPVKEL